MKKLICLLMIFAVLLSCCACGKKDQQATATTAPAVPEETTIDLSSPEAMYGHIDQNTPVDGVYKIWNAEGVKAMADRADGSFELLCNIDMEGATLRPIGSADKPFAGTLNGAFFTISNFTLEGGEAADFGFVAVNQGTVRDLLLKDVTYAPGANAKNIGTLVGDNRGEIIRCTLTGTMTVDAAAEGANIGSLAGCSTGSIKNSATTTDLLVTAPGAANVGGIVGAVNGGIVEYTDTDGKIDVTGTNKTVGLIAGESQNIVYTYCAFIGESNTVDGKLFNNFTGTEDDELVVAHDSVRRMNDREPLPENIKNLRDQVVQKMYDMGTIEWHVDKELFHDCKCGTSSTCVGVYDPSTTYIGMPYKHGNGTLTSFTTVFLDENNYVQDWVYDMDARNGYDSYMGSMCSSAANMAFWQVSNSIEFMSSQPSIPFYHPNHGCYPVGEGWWEDVAWDSGKHDSHQYTDSVSVQEWYEVLAQTWHGDGMTQGIEAGYHTVMTASDPVVVRDQHGNIDGVKSYIMTHEQGGGGGYNEEKRTWTSWGIWEKNTFAKILDDGFLPFRPEEFITGEMEPEYCEMLDNPGGYLGMMTGTVKGNYYLETVTLTITDSQGNVVFDKINFPKAGKFDDANTKATSLCYIDSYDMANFAASLQSLQLKPGETYSYKVAAHQAPGFDYVVFEDSFTYGSVK